MLITTLYLLAGCGFFSAAMHALFAARGFRVSYSFMLVVIASSAAFYLLFAALAYQSPDPESHFYWLSLQRISAHALMIGIVWVAPLFLGLANRNAAIFYTACYAALIAVEFIAPGKLMHTNQEQVLTFTLPWGETIQQAFPHPGLLTYGYYCLLATTELTVLFQALLAFRQGRQRQAILFFIAMAILITAQLVDSAIRAGWIQGFYVTEFALPALFILATLDLSRRILDSSLDKSALMASEERIRRTLDALDDAVIVTDINHRIISANPAAHKLFPQTDGSLIGKPLADAALFLNPETDKPTTDPARLAATQHVQIETVVNIRDQRGEKATLQVKCSPLSQSSGSRDTVLVLQDITHQQNVEKQLVHAQKMEAVGTLASGLAHDFNNILAGISGSADLLRIYLTNETLEKRQDIFKHLDTIRHGTDRAARSIRQLLRFSRQKTPHFETVDLIKVLHHSINLCENSLSKSVTLRAHLPLYSLMTRANAGDLEQAFVNLIINAEHAMTLMRPPDEPQGGVLDISVQRIPANDPLLKHYPDADIQHRYHLIKITDTGVGLSAEQQRHIFTPFYTTKHQEEGNGLGLAMVYNTLKQCGGFIDIKSSPGNGASFWLFFPAMEAASVQEPEADYQQDLQQGFGTILVVDDEIMIRDVAQDILRECGYQVLLAASGLEGITCFSQHRGVIRLIILDQAMPGMNGLQTLAQIRLMDAQVPVLMASALMDPDMEKQARRFGRVSVIEKPFTSQQLSQAVAKALNVPALPQHTDERNSSQDIEQVTSPNSSLH